MEQEAQKVRVVSTNYPSYVATIKTSLHNWAKKLDFEQVGNWEQVKQADLPKAKQLILYLGSCYGVRIFCLDLYYTD